MSHDVVVIGAGVNGLSAAALLAKAGRKVLVLESQDEPGGAVRTAEVTLPGYRHDLFATNLGLFAGGPVMAALGPELAAAGFELVPSSKPFCSVFPDGTMIGITQDKQENLRNIEAISTEDATAWQELTNRLQKTAPHLLALLGSEMPSLGAVRALVKARRSLGTDGVLELIRLSLQSTRSFGNEMFESPKMKALIASWGMHLDFAPDIPGGALFAFLESTGGQEFGMVIGKGGANSLILALVTVIENHGGEVRCGTRVEEIIISGAKAAGVSTEFGEHILASRAVISNVNPSLMPSLLPAVVKAQPQIARVMKFQPGLATMMIHLALDELPHWRSERAREFNYVHIGPFVDDMARTYADAAAGILPASPTLVVGQPTVVDSSRAPNGKHILWIQVRVLPLKLADGSTWDQIGEEYSERIIDKIEEYAPGLRKLILAKKVLTPADLERYNSNLIDGDSLGGSHHPAQFFFLRPVPGWGRHRTPIDRLFICGASTWPGGGVGGASGALVAKAVG
jgi:phytoene dehydrogenase-like protein